VSSLQKVLQVEADKRNLSSNDVLRLMDWADNVAQVESNKIATRTQGDSEQGIGRGKYQFESTKGSGAAKTAATRFFNWEKQNDVLEIPKEDREELYKEDPDFSKLSEETQDALFIIHHSLHPKTPLTDIAKGKVQQSEAWLKYHWAGNDKDKSSKQQQWYKEIELPKKAKIANTFAEAM